MRIEFTQALHHILENDPRSVFISGDLGFKAFEKIQEAFGKRFLNAGVAEQNMVGLGAGFSYTGLRPWLYSIVPFITLRCLEQIRNDICLHNLPVHIVGNGGGYTYGIMGGTHHALEDLGILKGLPNMTLFFPCENNQVEAHVQNIQRTLSPTYLRLAISGFQSSMPVLEENPETLTRHYNRGSKITLIGMGHALQLLIPTLEILKSSGVNPDLFGISKFPFQLEKDLALTESVRKTGKVLVVEEHYKTGGMGESLQASLEMAVPFKILAPYYFRGQRYGSPRFHLGQCRMDPENIAMQILEFIKSENEASHHET